MKDYKSVTIRDGARVLIEGYFYEWDGGPAVFSASRMVNGYLLCSAEDYPNIMVHSDDCEEVGGDETE